MVFSASAAIAADTCFSPRHVLGQKEFCTFQDVPNIG
jgi:hypothetical protein